MLDSNTARKNRWLLFSSWIVLSLALFLSPILVLVKLSLSQDDASYLVLIPFISAVILYLERDRIFPQVSTDRKLGGAFLFLTGLAALAPFVAKNVPSPGLQLSGWILTLVLLWVRIQPESCKPGDRKSTRLNSS